jgi:hypothetical protein
LLTHKWIESEKAGKDLGQEAVVDWVKKFAKVHRKEFIENKLIQAEKDLCCLKEDKNIPPNITELLNKIYDHIDFVKHNIEIDSLTLR